MHFFYIPDGHRRYSEQNSLSLRQGYERGYLVLRDEVLFPLCENPNISRVGVFLLSKLNLQKRTSEDLAALLMAVQEFVPRLCQDLERRCLIRVFGNHSVKQSINRTETSTGIIVDLYVGSDTDDPVLDGPADLLARSGGTLRLSGAPRALIGPYTEFFGLQKFHPDVKACDIEQIVSAFVQRYRAEECD
jgi:undecaprenyl pyrophosphate synthase